MAKSVIELLNEVKKSEELQKEVVEVLQKKDNQAMVDFLRKYDCDASLKEAKAALIEEGNRINEDGELTPEELEAAAGGTLEGIWVILVPILVSLGVSGITGGFMGASSCQSSSQSEPETTSDDSGC